MKNINVGITLDQVTATCNFCHEKDKQCYRSPYPVQQYKYVTTGWTTERGFIASFPKRIQEQKLVTIAEVDICLDCVRQLFTMTIRLNPESLGTK